MHRVSHFCILNLGWWLGFGANDNVGAAEFQVALVSSSSSSSSLSWGWGWECAGKPSPLPPSSSTSPSSSPSPPSVPSSPSSPFGANYNGWRSREVASALAPPPSSLWNRVGKRKLLERIVEPLVADPEMFLFVLLLSLALLLFLIHGLETGSRESVCVFKL